MKSLALSLIYFAFAISGQLAIAKELTPYSDGRFSVGSTNMEVVDAYANIGDDKMHEILLGTAAKTQTKGFITDILKYPESAWRVDVAIPKDSIYGPVAGQSLPILAYITFPATETSNKNSFTFPYQNAQFGIFEDMLEANERPSFADPKQRYPLILLAHGSGAHGIYDIAHAHKLSRHGFIVAVLFYGDDRTAIANSPNDHVSFLRPLLTKAMLDSILESETFGPHVDADSIGITGHSFGGFTALALIGGDIQGNMKSVKDSRITASTIAAPWVGGRFGGREVFAFGPNNASLTNITTPTLTFFGSKDEVTTASSILPAIKRLSGPSYLVELVDQPHVFEDGSWMDRDNWELLFFLSYLKQDKAALEKLKVGRSMKGGNSDIQLFEYQQLK